MTLLDLCEPLFLHICRLSRMARTMTSSEYAVVRADVKGLLDEIRQKANTDVRLASQVSKLDMPLMFFVDSMISEMNLKFSGDWNHSRLAYEFNELAGDEKFFHPILEETLNDSSEEAADRLAVFYVCLGLGFTGFYTGQPEQLRTFMNQIRPRIRHLVEADQTLRICKEAYENVDSRDLVEPPSGKVVWIVLLFVVFTLLALGFYYWMFANASENLRDSLGNIARQDSTQPPMGQVPGK